MQQEDLALIALINTPGIGPVTGRKLLERFGFPGAVFRADARQLREAGLPETVISGILEKRGFQMVDSQIEALRKSGGRMVTILDTDYPDCLKAVPDAPLILFIRGDWTGSMAQPRVAIVGSRHCSTYGRNITAKFARDLASHGITVVSGLARGIDSAAHEAVLEVDGRTIAVMGTGLDDVYPKENEKLAGKIAERGALVTEFPFDKPPLPQNFPYRNRVISGLSLGVVIVEAAEQSGSLITARLAMEQGREVFAVPGNLTSAKSIGPNRLIQDGAKLVMDWRDVVAEFSYELRLLMKRGETAFLPPAQPDLSEDEKAVFARIGLDTPVHIDQLFQSAGISNGAVLTALLGLEMKEVVRELPGKFYVRKL
jgi:DNA processing protein